jgi:hypothetical protein
MSKQDLFNFTNDSLTKQLADGFAGRDELQAAKARVQVNTKLFDSAISKAAAARGLTTDAIPADRGAFLARQLEFIIAELKELKRPPLNALKLFPISSSIPAGADSYVQRRIDGTAKVVFHRGQGSPPPVSSVNVYEEKFPIRTAVTGWRYSIFDLLHGDFAGLNLPAELAKATSRGVDQFLNENCWRGDSSVGLRGVLDAPFVARRFSASNWGTATTGDTILNDLQAAYIFPYIRSKQTFRPDRCAISPRLFQALKRKRGAGDPETILQAFFMANPELGSDPMAVFHECHELQGAGPSDQDVFFWYKGNDSASVEHVLPQALTMLPAQDEGFEVMIPGFLRYGGVRMDDPLYNLLNYTAHA